jgi:hypothetical protein
MIAFLEFVAVTYLVIRVIPLIGVALQWLFSARYRAEISNDQDALTKVGFGVTILVLIVITLIVFFIR